MFKAVTAKSIILLAVVALAICQGALLPSLMPEAQAAINVGSTHHQVLAKGDRLPLLLKGAKCSSRGWPHYEQSCQFDLTRLAENAPIIRVIALR
jgi:hypothetical protein